MYYLRSIYYFLHNIYIYVYEPNVLFSGISALVTTGSSE
jgi:hypothetical protein